MPVTQAAQVQSQARLQSWLHSQGMSPGSAGKSVIEQASKELNIPVADLHDARRALSEQVAAQVGEAGAGSAALTGRGQVSAGFGGGRVEQSPAMQVRGGGTTEPKLKAFEKSTYTLLDAREVMKEFGVAKLDDAKRFIGEKIITGQEQVLRDKGIRPDNFDSYECLDAFSRSSYSLDDAKEALKQFSFLSSVEDAKEYIGLKIVNGPDYEKSILGAAGITPHTWDRHECLAAFDRSTYSEHDVLQARRAFSFLKGSTVGEVKEYIGLKIVNGYEKMLSDAGITPHTWDRHELMAAFKTSTYSSSDVKAAKQAFDFLKNAPDNEVREYIGLKIVNGYEEMLSSAGITPQHWDDHELLDAFKNSGYDKHDVSDARQKLDFLNGASDVEVMRYIGLKIVNGPEYERDVLGSVGITPKNGQGYPSQAEMNQQAAAALEKAKGKLHDASSKLGEQLDPVTKKDLKGALAAFEKYASAEGTFAGNLEARGGSLMPLIASGATQRLTDKLRRQTEAAGDSGYFTYRGSAKPMDAGSQQAMNQAAYAALEKQNDKMNKLVAQLEQKLDPESKKELASTQKAFETFREAQATLAGNMEARGGSLFGLIYASSADALTRERIALLQEHVKLLGQ